MERSDGSFRGRMGVGNGPYNGNGHGAEESGRLEEFNTEAMENEGAT